MKVQVFDTNQEPIGIGDFCRTEDIQLAIGDDDGRVVCTLKDHPVIVMEDGEILRGIDCWWYPL